MTVRFVNTAILIFTLLVTLTGVYGIVWVLDGWMYDAHRILAWSLFALIPWKTIISLRSLRRGLKLNINRGVIPIVSLLLTGMILFVFALGLMWAWRIGPQVLWLRETVIFWHWILALALLPPFLLHSWRRWPKPKPSDFLSRSGFLKTAALALVGVAGWWLAEIVAFVRQDADAPRAITGSRLDGYFSGNDYPVTTGAGDGKEHIDLDTWRLRVGGAVHEPLSITYADLLQLSQTAQVTTLDCTIGWYSVQRWRGVALIDVLNMAAVSPGGWTVVLKAASGYRHTLTLAEAQDILLATHVGGEPLTHQHGFPLRAVVPSRRGWFWIKWLTELEVLS